MTKQAGTRVVAPVGVMPIGQSAQRMSRLASEYRANDGVSRDGSPILANSMFASADWLHVNPTTSPANFDIYSSVSEVPESPRSSSPGYDAYPPPPPYNWFDPPHAHLSPQVSYSGKGTPDAKCDSFYSTPPSHAPPPAMSAAFTSHMPPSLAPGDPLDYSAYHTMYEPTCLTDNGQKAEDLESSHSGPSVNWRGIGQRLGQSCQDLATGVATGTRAWNTHRTRPQDAGQSLVTNALQGVLRGRFGADPRKWDKWRR
jgi:hypothetical protein